MAPQSPASQSCTHTFLNTKVTRKESLGYACAATDGTLATTFSEDGSQLLGAEDAYRGNGYIISSPDAARRSLYVEMVSNGKDTLKVGYDLSYTSYNQYFANLEEQIKPYDTTSLIYKTYTAERERLTAVLTTRHTRP